MSLDRDLLNRLLAPLRTRISGVVVRAIVKLVDDSKKMQALQLSVLAAETREGVERFQNYGVTSVPFGDAEALVLCVGGRREHAIVVAVDDRRYRLKDLAAGETALYTRFGSKVLLKANGDVEVTPKSGQDIKLAAGSKKVARLGDTTKNGSLSGTVMVAGAPVSVLFTYTGPDGIPGSPNASATLKGEIDSGAEHVKA